MSSVSGAGGRSSGHDDPQALRQQGDIHLPLKEHRLSVGVDGEGRVALDVDLPAGADADAGGFRVGGLLRQEQKEHRLKAGYAGHRNDVQPVIAGVRVRAEFKASALVGVVHGRHKKRVRKGAGRPVIQCDSDPGRPQEVEPVQRDQRVGQLAQVQSVQDRLQPGDHRLVADCRVKAESGADRKALAVPAVYNISYIHIRVRRGIQYEGQSLPWIGGEAEKSGEIISRADGDIAQRGGGKVLYAAYDFVYCAISPKDHDGMDLPVRREFPGQTGSVALTAGQIRPVGNAPLPEDRLQALPDLPAQAGAGGRVYDEGIHGFLLCVGAFL